MKQSAKQFINDLNALNDALELEDVKTAELGLSDYTFHLLEREDIQSYFDGNFSDSVNLWLLQGTETVIEELGLAAGREVVTNLSTTNKMEA